MKRIALIALVLLFAGAAFADSTNISSRRIAYDHTKGDIVSLVGGEHNYVQWTGTATIAAAQTQDSVATYWMQYSPVYGISDTAKIGYNKGQLFPRVFTLDVSVAVAAGDSFSLGSVDVQYAWANGTAKPIRNADSTFALVADGNYNRPDYAVWTYEDIPEAKDSDSNWDNYTWRYMIKCEAPGFMRLIFKDGTLCGDAVTITWTLTGMYQ